MNLVNKQTSGHWLHENEPGRKLQIDTGLYTADGQKRFIPIFLGTGFDWIKLPYEIADGALSGDESVVFRALRNRLNPVLGQVVTQMTNVNFAGGPVVKKDASFTEGLKARAGEAISTFLPGIAANPLRQITGSGQGWESTVAQSLELPIKYGGGAYSKSDVENRDLLKSVGASGQQIYEQNNPEKPKQPGLWERIFGSKKSETSTETKGDLLLDMVGEENLKDKNATRIREISKLDLNKDQFKRALTKEGFTYEQAQMVLIKALPIEDGTRGKYFKKAFKDLSPEETKKFTKTLIENELLTTAVVSEWYRNDEITKAQKDAFTKTIKSITEPGVDVPVRTYKAPSVPRRTRTTLKRRKKLSAPKTPRIKSSRYIPKPLKINYQPTKL